MLACDGLVERRDREENKIESKALGWERRTRRENPPAASRFTKVRCFFPVFVLPRCSGVATSPLGRLLSTPYRSQVFWSFEQAGALLFLPILLILLPPPFVSSSPTNPGLSPRLPAGPEPFSILRLFMFFQPLFLSLLFSSLLSAVSTSISKKSSRELFVGKCREPAVLRTG